MLTTSFRPQIPPLKGQDTLTLKEIWRTIDAESCPHYYNFHMHTVYSDGQLTPEEVIEQALAINLQGLAITDHHTVDGYYIAYEYLKRTHQQANSLPKLWTGVEITALLLDTEVHILGYGFNPENPSIRSYLQGDEPAGKMAEAEAVINAIHDAGGLVVLAHPERYRRSAKALIPRAVKLGIDGVETYYAYKNTLPWTPSPKQTAIVKALSDRYGLFNTCGTDTHGLNLLRRV
ncbi:PHP domain-containing protein [Euhalothece natronophila Z-M001]|uniref:PHP domain-containing protein n=1 Tax=Euhalothece natronophila Z-M001 TaxID=522448 RepID=A0A5B8NL82_9CHRO|nr:PHP domain-containing protein [Euhalothece natronophila]QDZ39766.1 PHP domain-containing protein [Euhalothece natronophila Z-M001]